MKNKLRKGLTLIELLVVISIVAILGAIVYGSVVGPNNNPNGDLVPIGWVNGHRVYRDKVTGLPVY